MNEDDLLDEAAHPAAHTVTLDLPHNIEAPALARRFVEAHRDHLPPELIEDAQLLVTELVTNAVRYGQPEIRLAVKVAPPLLGVWVMDRAPELPAFLTAVPQTQTSGRGLQIVDAIAADWGVTESGTRQGKAVWFTLQILDDAEPAAEPAD